MFIVNVVVFQKALLEASDHIAVTACVDMRGILADTVFIPLLSGHKCSIQLINNAIS